uniref:Uncharacterized protein n=1 Tax=Anguilla anguilla TaxID=7936 RepID=A0A0E9RML5_ANGAN
MPLRELIEKSPCLNLIYYSKIQKSKSAANVKRKQAHPLASVV